MTTVMLATDCDQCTEAFLDMCRVSEEVSTILEGRAFLERSAIDAQVSERAPRRTCLDPAIDRGRISWLVITTVRPGRPMRTALCRPGTDLEACLSLEVRRETDRANLRCV